MASVAATASLVHVPWSLTARANIGALTTRLNAEIISDLGARVSGLLDDAVAAQLALASNIEQGVIGLEDRDRRRTLFLSFMQGQPTLSSIELVWPDDRSFGVRRHDSHSVHVEEVRPVPGRPLADHVVDRYELDEVGRPAFVRRETNLTEYAGTRQFWYRLATGSALPMWSNIYPMANSGRLGFATVRQVTTPGGDVCVLAVSIELGRISAFLEGIHVSPNGTVFLTNRYEELVASRSGSGDAEPRTGPISRLADERDPLVQVAVRAFESNGLRLRDLDGTRQLISPARDSGERFFVTVAPLTEMDLVVALVVPEEDILGDIDRNTRWLAVGLGGFTLLLAGLVVLAARRLLALPLADLATSARRLGEFRFDEVRPVSTGLSEVRTLSTAVTQMSAGLASFRKYVPVDVVRMLFAQGVEAELGGERRELSILFMDLANFTSISESLGEDLFPFLGIYLNEMSTVLRAQHATIDKYIGDAIMAFWGAPAPAAEHALLACRAALACQSRLAQIRRERAGFSGPEIRARIGINTGTVLVGNVGSRDRLNYTAIGDPVNVASRLESLNKRYGTEILIGEETFRQVEAHVVARRLDRVAVYGKAEGVAVYELIGLAEGVSAETREWVRHFERGMRSLSERRWDEAAGLFTEVIGARGGQDGPSRLLLERTLQLRERPPARDWDGLVVIDAK
jgi:adenylate cyclase